MKIENLIERLERELSEAFSKFTAKELDFINKFVDVQEIAIDAMNDAIESKRDTESVNAE